MGGTFKQIKALPSEALIAQCRGAVFCYPNASVLLTLRGPQRNTNLYLITLSSLRQGDTYCYSTEFIMETAVKGIPPTNHVVEHCGLAIVNR